MKYTTTISQPLSAIPSKNGFVFNSTFLGAGKTAPFFVSVSGSLKNNQMIRYNCAKDDKDDKDDDYIEVPGGTESIVYTDDDGNKYEVSISDLQEYDGDDGEIKYTKSSKNLTIPLMTISSAKNKFMRYPSAFMNKYAMQRVYGS